MFYELNTGSITLGFVFEKKNLKCMVQAMHQILRGNKSLKNNVFLYFLATIGSFLAVTHGQSFTFWLTTKTIFYTPNFSYMLYIYIYIYIYTYIHTPTIGYKIKQIKKLTKSMTSSAAAMHNSAITVTLVLCCPLQFYRFNCILFSLNTSQ